MRIKTARMGIMKADSHARQYWRDAYEAIPKSVFATMAWHLANLTSQTPDELFCAENRAIEELMSLKGQVIPEQQAERAIKAILASIAKAGA